MNIAYRKVENADQAFTLLKATVTDEYLSQFKVKADMIYNEASKLISAKGKGFELNMSLMANEAKIDLDLGMLLKPFKSKILSTLETKLKEIL